MVAQVTLLLFDMSQIKKVSLKPGFENTVIDWLSSTVLESEFQTAGAEYNGNRVWRGQFW